MALPQNRLIPLLGLGAAIIAATVVYKSCSSADGTEPGARMKSVPSAAASASGADGGSPFSIGGKKKKSDGDDVNDTLRTLAATIDNTNSEIAPLRKEVQDLKTRLDSAERSGARRSSGNWSLPEPPLNEGNAKVAQAGASAVTKQAPEQGQDGIDQAINQVADAMSALNPNKKGVRGRGATAPSGMPPGLGYETQGVSTVDTSGRPLDGMNAGVPLTTSYTTVAPLGHDSKAKRAVRPVLDQNGAQREHAGDGGGARSGGRAKEEATPYFTIPENATLTRVKTMTALVGRVPIDGRVQDPMEFKVIVGRENLAANGMNIPDDVSGIVVSGTAVGDMTMSCSEGHVYSLTFIFNDGSVRTVSTRKGATAPGRDKALGYISDEFGNPCIAGRFVTNAPAYLTDVVGLRTLAVAGKAYAAAQTTTTDSGFTGTSSTSVTGQRGAYVLGQAASAGVDEVSNWLLSRLKNSFDAVVTPADQSIVLHMVREVAIDKDPNPRRLDHTVGSQTAPNGDHHGLD